MVTSFNELNDLLLPFAKDKLWYFRGQSNIDWKLLPKAGRSPYNEVDDKPVFKSFKRQAIEFVDLIPDNDWDWLTVAQHHGLATRLLDWTTNPLVAAFFAVRELSKGPAVIFAAKFKSAVPQSSLDPMIFKDLAVFRPARIVPRITRQGGLFTIHPNPKEPLLESSPEVLGMKKILIEEGYRKQLMADLSFYGVNSSSLFPDLDGVCSFLNWTIETKEYWRQIENS